jgi:hypothetical protein
MPSDANTAGSASSCCPQHTDESYAFALLRDGTAGLAYLLKDRLADLEDHVRAVTGLHHQLVDVDDRVDGGDPLMAACLAGQQTRYRNIRPPMD